MEYIFKNVELKRYLRRDRITGEESVVSVTNRNGLPEDKHLCLLNSNDMDYEYLPLDGNEERMASGQWFGQ